MPNSELIAHHVVNWTLSDPNRRLEVKVAVACGTRPEQALELLLQIAADHPKVLKLPAPQAVMVEFGDSALNFILYAWTASDTDWVAVKSDLLIAIEKSFREAHIDIPYPRYDLHMVEPKA